ncbi:hypothetical protein RHGRI_019859 [Rhododendron griersonianum]|uniref:RRM domain-containing protein n=1 Tax=Rhododendron griersonianum TaxID=479676 RepID=A0AAV6JEA3_9ERIC|nr:hypothetical protein RHGRI_019859 [Rhododendron griersonianum]
MDEVWLKQIFSGAGKITQVYIPWKRSFRLNQRFGFVRFGLKADGMRAIKMWNTAQIQGHRLLVKEARFNNTRWNNQGQKKVGESKVYRAVKNKNPRVEETKWIPKSPKAGNGAQPCIKVSEEGNEWLTRSAIAKLSPLRSMVYMEDLLRNFGYSDIQVRPMDSDRVVLTFPSIEDRDSIFNGGNYNVRVSEEQYVINTFLRSECKCKGCGLDEVQSVVQNSNGSDENIMMERVETNEEVEKAVGLYGGSLQLVKAVGTDGEAERSGCKIDLAARDFFSSSLGIGISVRGSGKVWDSLGEGAGYKSLPITNLAPLTVIGLNRMLLSPRVSLSNLVENQNSWAAKSVSWVANSVNENPTPSGILSARKDDDAIGDGHPTPPGILSERNDDDAIRDGRPDQNEANHSEDDPCLAPLKATINGVKGKKKRKSIHDILGFTKVNLVNNKGRKNKQKCEVFRSAIAAVALSASISSEGIVNRNRIILDEAQAIWECNKIMGMGYDGDEDEVISRLADMEAQDLDRADRAAVRQL